MTAVWCKCTNTTHMLFKMQLKTLFVIFPYNDAGKKKFCMNIFRAFCASGMLWYVFANMSWYNWGFTSWLRSASGEKQQHVESADHQPQINANEMWMRGTNNSATEPVVFPGRYSSFVFVLNNLTWLSKVFSSASVFDFRSSPCSLNTSSRFEMRGAAQMCKMWSR